MSDPADKKRLRIVFMGTPEFAVETLQVILDSDYDVAGVITAPDKPAGRGRKVASSAVKEFALQSGLQVLQPTNLKDNTFISELRGLEANLQVVVAFRMLPEIVWQMPELGTFNLHASLLPQYRGAAPINWAIMNGEKRTGVTTFFLQHEIDTGNIILQESLNISDHETAGELHDRLKILGSKLVLKTLRLIEAGNVQPIDQENISVNEPLRKAPKIHREDCRIDWSKPLNEVHNHIRGLSPYPCAHTELRDQKGNSYPLKVYKVRPGSERSALSAPKLFTDGRTFLGVRSGSGELYFDEIQLAGKKRMEISEFLRGFEIDESFIIQ